MNTFVTGASGFVGQALIPKLLAKGEHIIALARDKEKAKKVLPPEVEILEGDILMPNLGVDKAPKLEKLFHLAALHRLGEDKDSAIWETNVVGTQNVIEFCENHNIPHLYLVSTAYTAGRNRYERSKAFCETLVKQSSIPNITIFKPSIVMGTPQHFYPGHFSQFVLLVINLHQRAETLRKKMEGSLRLPVLEPVFRLKANPQGKLNLIQIDEVAKAMTEIEEPGTYWLTHPSPPTLDELVEWVGEFIMVRMKIESNFKATPIEAAFERMAAAFIPYLWGDNFPSDLKDCSPITREYIQQIITKTLFA